MHSRALFVIGAFIAPLLSIPAVADGYLRASVIQVTPEEDGSDDAIGAMIALGTMIPAATGTNFHQFELELGTAKWDDSESFVDGGVTYSLTADVKVLPALLTYRFQWQLNDRLNLAIGPSAGATNAKLSASATDGITTIRGSDTDWVLSYGAGAHFNIQLSSATTLTLGYRYLVTDEAKFEYQGVEIPSGDLDAHLFEVGFRFNWPTRAAAAQ